MIRPVTEADLPALLALYNGEAGKRGIYAPLTGEAFRHAMRPEREGLVSVCFLAEEGGEVLGFAAGNAEKGAKNAYLTCILTRRDRSGAGKGLLAAVEGALADEAQPEKLRVLFYNPASLPWVVPETGGALHPVMPVVDLSSRAYIWLQNRGFRNYCFLNAYYKRLGDEAYPQRIAEKIAENEKRGLFVTLYDREAHGSLVPLLDALGSAGWRETLLSNEAQPRPLPLPVAVDRSPAACAKNGGKAFVCGFAGPVYREGCGRGWFAGIGIHPEYRKNGLGSTLFAFLCRSLASLGAEYMTLYTGEDGAARRIYEAAGFRVARGFAGMEKGMTPPHHAPN